MKVDTSRLKKGTSEVPPECQHLIDRLRQCSRSELAYELSRIETWTFGKCELYHWIDILDIFDAVLEEATEIKDQNDWCLACDQTFTIDDKRLLLYVLNFTTLLIEHSFSRHLYNSVEHLTRLLSSSNMEIVLGVLNLLYMFSKRSNFISRLNSAKKNSLLARLNHIAENWGGKDCGFGLANCCRDNIQLPSSSSTFYYEYYDQDGALQTIEIPALDQSKQSAAELAKEICAKIDDLDDDQKMHIFTRIRLSLSFHNYIARLQFVQARLQSLSVLVYSNSLQENIHTLLYSGFLEELVELLEMKDTHLVEIRAAALRTLTSIIHLDRNPHFPKKPGSRLAMIIDVTGASSYHGFLPTLVRNCIQNLTLTSSVLALPPEMTPSNSSQPMIINDEDIRQQQKHLLQLQLQTKILTQYHESKQQLLNLFPLPLATALFSFLYHLASYDTGGEALVACGMMESLLRVINWPGYELEHITFVTRAVRVIDLITNIDMQSFQNHGGLNSFIGRLDMEVNFCRREQPFEIEPQHDQQAITNMNLRGDDSFLVSDDTNMSTDDVQQAATASTSSSSSSYSSTAVKISTPNLSNSLQSFEHNSCNSSSSKASKNSKTCLPQRAALLKSMLNFLKKAIQDPAFSDSIRHVMEGTLPNSLRHIISNAEYYGPSLFLLATDVVTVYVFQEPSLLSSLQDNGLTDVVLQALLKKDVPATREVLGSLPNVFSALCLNARGLLAFVKYDPFDRLFKVLLSPVYLMAMRRRRSSDPMGDTASNLGNAMDELMRHQPSLKPEATKAIIKLLEELVILGTDSKYICWRATNKNEASPAPASRQSSGNAGNDAGSSDEEDDDEEEASTSSHHNQRDDNSNHDGDAATGTSPTAGGSAAREASSERTPIPLIDYILNVMKFVDAILSNNSTDDHCREFVSQDGLQPLLSILALPNLPVDSPITASAQAVAAVCKSILNLAHEGQVLQVGLEQLSAVVEELKPLQAHIASPGGSVLLRELANCPNIDGAFSNASYTPLLHAMSAVHGYVVMLVHVCRTGQSDIRSLLLKKWGMDTRYGKKLLRNLVELYTALVWESTLLLALCTDDIFPSGCEFGKEDIEKLPSDNPEEKQSPAETAATSTATTTPSSAAMELDDAAAPGKDDATKQPPKKKMIASPGQLRYIKALLGASSRLGRALAELFGNLVKLCVGSPIRQRRGQNFPPTPAFTSSDSRDIARVLSYILVDGFSYKKLKPSPIPKLKLTFLICSVGFTGPMLFDEKRYAFHLMLHKFVQEGGLDAFFGMFEWAVTSGWTVNVSLTLDNKSFPEGTGEFLDAWLMLLEKMVNPKAILESPHVINNSRSSRGKNDFDGILYLSTIHRLAFSAVTRIWGMKPIQTYGVRMTESMMSILKHILKGERLIREKSKKRTDLGMEKDKTEPAAAAATVAPTAAAAPDPVAGNSSSGATSQAGTSTQPTATSSAGGAPALVNQDHLKQLMDMGFNRDHVTDALLHTATVEQATEYLLCNPPPPPPPPVISELPTDESSNSMDLDIVPRRADDGEDDSTVLALPTPDNPYPSRYYLSSGPPLTEEIIVPFSYVAVKTCLYLMDALPETVPKGTELLAILFRRNRFGWKTDMLSTLVEQMSDCLKRMTAGLKNETFENIDNDIYYGETANKFHVRIHIYSIFMDEIYPDIRVPAIQVLKAHNAAPKFIELFLLIEKKISQRAVESGGTRCGGSPKWLAQLVVFLDLYEKVAVYTQRRADMHKVTTKIWKWYDVASGKWNAYSVSNNKIINDAYFTGESSIRISCGRQRYAINFNCMSQVNEETGNHRPVILALKATEGRPSLSSDDEVATDSDDDDITVEQPKKVKRSDAYDPVRSRRTPPPFIENDFTAKLIGLEEFDTGNLVSVCVRLMTPPIGIDRDTLHAIMKLCVRLTKSFENAEIFARDGGVRLLLNMRQTCSYIGFPTLSILLIRHVLEEPRTLALAMERVIATRTIQTIPPGYRDLVFLLRQMSSAVSRDPKTFKEVAQAMLRIDISVLRRNSLSDDNRLLLKSVPNVKRFETMEESASVQVVHDLLMALIVPCVHLSPSHSSSQLNQDQQNSSSAAAPAATSSSSVATAPTTCHSIQPQQNITIEVNNPFQHLSYPPIPPVNPTRRITTAGNANIGGSSSAAVTADMNKLNENEEQCCGWHIPCATHEHDKPLLPRATILKFLADAVRSYQTFAPLITEHVYKAGDSPLITEDTSALSFILDKLLPITELTSDREVTSMSRALIASLASCSEQPTVQYTVVSEVKAAINRALALPESADKHSQLQILAAIIPTMIENCPPENTALLKLHHLQPRRNDIFYIMVRKGLITDLARLTQYLDLSSPYTIATVNSALKPLETLLRMTNQPGPVPLSAKAKKAASQPPEGGSASAAADDDNDDGEGVESNSVGSRHPTTHMDEDDEDLQGDDDSSSQRIPPNTIQRNRLVASAIAEYASALEEHLGEAANVDQDEIAVENEVIARQQSNDGTQVNLEDIMDQLLERSSGNDRNASQISATVEVRGSGSGDENIDVDFNARVETSSESGDSDSNGSDNEEREIDDEEENEEEAEDRSEIDVDEETRQFIELYDHVYGRHLSPSIPELERDTDDILMIRLNSLRNQAEQGTPEGTVESNTNQSGSVAGGENGNTTSGIFHNTFPNIFETVASGGTGTSGGSSASPAGHQNSSAEAAARADETAAARPASLTLPAAGSSAAAAPSSSGVVVRRHHIYAGRSLITNVTLSSSRAGDRTGASASATGSGITRTTGVSSIGVTGAGGPSMQPEVNVTLASQLQSSVTSTGALSAAAAHHRQHTPMSLGQRLVAVTRTFRTQLANTVAETNNMRQRRYQLLNLNSRNTPIILQRLLGNGPQNGANAGAGSNQDISDGTAGTSGTNSNANAFRDATRVVLMDNAFGIFSHTDEGSIDLVDQAGYLFGRSLAATLSSTPTALHWWLEEAKALGLESQSDICLSVADSLIPELEMQKALELAKIRGKKKKKAEEEAAKAAAAAAAAANGKETGEAGTQTTSTAEQAMETSDHNLEQSSNDNARNFVIGMDTTAANESSNQDDSNTTVNVVLDHLQREISGDDSDDLDTNQQRIPRNTNGGASAVQNEAMSATSTSDFISDTEHETDDGRTSPTADFSSIILPLEDDENDDENDEDDEEEDDEDEDDDDDEEEEEEDDDDDDEIEEDDDDVIHNTNSSDQDSSEMDNAVVVFNRRSGGNDGDEDEEEDNVEADRHRRRRRRLRNPQPENQNQNSSSNQSQQANGGGGGQGGGGGGNHNNPDLGEIGSLGESEGTTGERQESGGEIDSSGQNDDEDGTTSLANLHSMMIDESDLIPLPAIDDDEEDDDVEDDEDELDNILHMLDNQANIPRRRPIAVRTATHQDDSVASEQNRTNETQEEEGAVGGVDLTSTTAAAAATTTTAATTTSSRQSTSTSTEMPPPSSSQAPSASRATASSSVLGDLEIPEGVDPSFLAALPQEMREEVIAEHLRLQRLRQRAQQNAIQVEHASVVEVNPEFLAALPINLQEEVLAQQRIEQQRQAAAAANPNDPVDAAAFFQNLQPSLRQAILTDMEDSQISVLPPDLAAEAQNLRRDWETRNRQMMQERLLNQIGSATTHLPSVRYLYRRPRFPGHTIMRTRLANWNMNGNATDGNSASLMTLMERHGRPLLDHEALTSLLILLFIDEPKFNTLRLHRVIRNLCCHVPTREWIIKALLSIVERSNATSLPSAAAGSGSTAVATRPQWLNIRLDAALGSRANVFVIKKSGFDDYTVSIHPQAAQIVCKHTLDLLITLAKSFPKNFLPYQRQQSASAAAPAAAAEEAAPPPATEPAGEPVPTTSATNSDDSRAPEAKKMKTDSTPAASSSSSSLYTAASTSTASSSYDNAETAENDDSTDFWDIIVKLDCSTPERKAQGPALSSNAAADAAGTSSSQQQQSAATNTSRSHSGKDIMTFDESPFGQLISMLSFDIVKKSCQLTDKLLRLLSFISVGLPDEKLTMSAGLGTSATSTGLTTNESSNSSVASGGEQQQQQQQQQQAAATTTELEKANESILPNSEQQLFLGIEVLTSKSCSEEGLEDATSLLLNMSQCSNQTRTVILNLLIRGAKDLAEMVKKHITDLMCELKDLNRKHQLAPAGLAGELVTASSSAATDEHQAPTMTASTGAKTKGILQDRFTKETVIITAPSKVKQTCDLQLSTMVPLILKTSSQAFFLRILKVIIQIREAVREANSKDENKGRIILGENELAPLSAILDADELWDTLSECLLDLEETADNHAVLVLQPAVEAFFLVHASTQSKRRQPAASDASSGEQSGQAAAAAAANDDLSPAVSPQQQEEPEQAPDAVASPQRPEQHDSGDSSEPVTLFEITTGPITEVIPGPALTQAFESMTAARPMQQDNDENSGGGGGDGDSNPYDQDAFRLADQKKFLQFAEKHRTVLNQILRQTTTHLSDGPFAVLVDHTRILDFDVKRRYFRTELERLDEGIRREELAVHVHRVTVFEDSFRELYRRNPEEWKNRFYIVFEDEEGQDAGGLLREWYVIISREIFNPMYALFTVSPGDRVTYMINSSSHANPNHLCYYKFVGRVIAKAIYDNKLLECYFTRSFYKHILGIQVKYSDMESEDYEFYKGLVFLLENHISALGYELTYSLEVQEFGVTEIRDLITNGRNIPVTEDNKLEYIYLVCQLKMSGSIRQQLNAFLEGFYDIIPKRLISIFNEQELELLISGLPNVDIEDLKANTEYHKYQVNSMQIQWFWRALRSFDQADRAKFLQFVTGTSKVPLQGFGALEGMNGTQKFQIHRDDRSTDRLPSAHTCFNQLDLPVYKTYDKLRSSLLKAIHECSEGFGFA